MTSRLLASFKFADQLTLIPSDIYEGSFGIQYSVTRDLAFEINYVFNQGRHLWSLSNENQGILNDPGSPPIIPFPLFVQGTTPTYVEWLDSNLSSSYNGLQVSVEQLMSNVSPSTWRTPGARL